MSAVRLALSRRDLALWTEVRNAVEVDAPSTSEDLQIASRRQPETRYWLAEEEGLAVGCSFVMFSAVPGRAFLLPRVVPSARGRGAGSALLEAGLVYARSLGRERARTSVDGGDAGSQEFAARRGFEEVDRQVELVRPLTAHEPPAQAPPGLELLRLEGTVVPTVAGLVAAGVADMPVVGGLSAGTADELLDELVRAVHVVAARERETVVGVAGLLPYGAREGALEHAFTTVRPSHRRRGVALALKQACIHWAAGAGYRELVTWTQAGNAGMQAVNGRAGFVPGTVSLTLEAPL